LKFHSAHNGFVQSSIQTPIYHRLLLFRFLCLWWKTDLSAQKLVKQEVSAQQPTSTITTKPPKRKRVELASEIPSREFDGERHKLPHNKRHRPNQVNVVDLTTSAVETRHVKSAESHRKPIKNMQTSNNNAVNPRAQQSQNATVNVHAQAQQNALMKMHSQTQQQNALVNMTSQGQYLTRVNGYSSGAQFIPTMEIHGQPVPALPVNIASIQGRGSIVSLHSFLILLLDMSTRSLS
jgi:hypothetical protein